jgi:hypothetical protein
LSKAKCVRVSLSVPHLGFFRLSARSGMNPFSDDAALEFGEDSAHLKHCPACRRAGIESLLMQLKITFESPQVSQ